MSHDSSGTSDAPHDGAIDAPSCFTKPTSLAARWRGEQTAVDSESRYPGTTSGNVTYAAGKHGSAFLFDGSSYITINDSDALWPSGSFSIEMWVNTTHSGALIQKYQCWNYCPNNIATAYWALALSTGGNAEFDLRADASQTIAVVSDSLHSINDGQWHHLVGVRDSTSSKQYLYVDGAIAVSANLAQANNGPMTNTDGEADPIGLAASPNAGVATYTPTLNGAIDEVTFYTDALSAQQVSAIYNAPQGVCL